jgi:hypothetical protein
MDIKLNDDYTPVIINGDFALLSSQQEYNEQNANLLLLLDKGHIRHYPQSGIGINKEINSKLTHSLKRRIEKELLDNGILADLIEQVDKEININLR